MSFGVRARRNRIKCIFEIVRISRRLGGLKRQTEHKFYVINIKNTSKKTRKGTSLWVRFVSRYSDNRVTFGVTLLRILGVQLSWDILTDTEPNNNDTGRQ
uniref:Uncharacterized protein n=1 Tax=Cacopsylla melanoneura TaxID=428564 RepID=A0A8D8XGJ6_9HEMI